MNLHHGDIVNLIKDSGYSVTLTIGVPLGKFHLLRCPVLRYMIIIIIIFFQTIRKRVLSQVPLIEYVRYY